MSSPINLDLFVYNVDLFLVFKVPTSDVKNFIYSHPNKIKLIVGELGLAIDDYNKFRSDINFKNRNVFINSLNLDFVFKKNLPGFTDVFKNLEKDISLSNSVYQNLGEDDYFKEVWKIRPISYLVINLMLLVYRTMVLFTYREFLFDDLGNRLVQISSAVEEMVFYRYVNGGSKNIFPAFKKWLENWDEEGFDRGLYELVYKTKKGS